jgi:acyl-CoA thioesterase I
LSVARELLMMRVRRGKADGEAVVSIGKLALWAASTAFAVGLNVALAEQPSQQQLDERMCSGARSAAYDAGPALAARPTTIVAVGSSSTEGTARNSKDSLYPAAMQSALRKMWPGADIHVINKGKGGETMQQTLERFDADVVALKPSLVIWQLGVNDVLRFNGLDGRRDEIKSGLRKLTDAGIPVVLLDLQYAPVVIRDPDALPMQDLIGTEVKEGPRGRVFHFRRFAVMKQLAEQNQVAATQMTESDGLHMTDQMHHCIGNLLAEMIGGTNRTAVVTDVK